MKRGHVYAGIFVSLFVAVLIVVVVCFTSVNGWKDNEDDSGLPFWMKEVVYQVYPRSFKDFDGDGTGDLKGIAERVDHLVNLGVGVVWLSPIYASPMKDFGYDISNYTAVDPTFGTMEDFDALLQKLHSQGLKLVMDFVPNHSSDQHEWFRKSVAREKPYDEYYVWADPRYYDPEGNPWPPNNWVSEFRGSAWEWNEERKQYYYHEFLKEQPDLNYRSQHVRREMEEVMRFWLDKGVDGFRVDALKYLFETEDVSLNEPVNPDSGTDDPDDPAYLEHIYTTNLPGTFEVLAEWRALVDEYPEKLLMVEVYDDVEMVMKYYGNDTVPLADFPFNFFLLDNLQNRSLLTGEQIKDTISLWLENMPEGKWANWVLGNHDNGRVASRLGEDLVDALNMVLLLLPGTPVTYYGEEIGMENTFISWEDTKDPEGCRWGPDYYQEHSRDPERTPMQWSNGHMADFTTSNDPWLPLNPNFEELNVAIQESDEQSPLKVYRQLIQWRQEYTFRHGALSYPKYDEQTFSFIRSLEGHTSYLVVVNTAEEDRVENLRHEANFPLPDEAVVLVRSSSDTSNVTSIGSVVSLGALPLLAGEGLLLELP